MKFLIALFALVAVASAQFELPTVVEGAKATLVGPSGTLHADSGAIVKSGNVLGTRLISNTIVSPRVALPTFAHSLYDIPTTRILPSLRIEDPFLLNSGFYYK